jgi:hypothetical protein
MARNPDTTTRAYQTRTTVTLRCKHQIIFSSHPPTKNETIWCKRCSKYVLVEVGVPGEYRTRCTADGCSFGRSFGKYKQGAVKAAVKHVNVRPLHVVVILEDGVKIDVVEISQEAMA